MQTVINVKKDIKKKKQRLTHEEYITEVYRLHKGIMIIGTYQGAGKPISYQCHGCKGIHPIKQAADLIGKKGEKRKYTCRDCFWEDRHKEHREEARKRAMEKLEKFPTITLLSEYRDEKENRLFFVLSCQTCHHKWDINATSNMKAHWKGCPSCWMESEGIKKAREKGRKITIAKKQKEAKQTFLYVVHGNEKMRVLDDYQDSRTTLRFQCTTCSHIWRTSPGHIVHNKSGCPKCNQSKGEKRILQFLQSKHIAFEREWKNHTCCYKKLLPFDFYLPHYHLAIEFQGIQHEQFSPHFHRTKKNFYEQQQRDALKKQYCKHNTIHFLEIWYHEMDQIEEILHKKILELENGIVHN